MKREETGRRRPLGMNVGSASLVTIFSVLCLTVFAVMAASTAQSEWKLTRRSADAVAAYYRAETRAAQLWEQLQAGYDPAVGFVLPAEGADGPELTLTGEPGEQFLSYQIPVDGARVFCVLLQGDSRGARVVYRAVQTVGDWSPDQTISVWTGEE